jgi:hypothetical protein
VYENCGKFGRCDCPLVETSLAVDTEGPLGYKDEECVIFTLQDFGCIQFTPKHGNIVTKL